MGMEKKSYPVTLRKIHQIESHFLLHFSSNSFNAYLKLSTIHDTSGKKTTTNSSLTEVIVLCLIYRYAFVAMN